MKKLIFFSSFLFASLFASEKELYSNYVKKIIEYHFYLQDFKTPFKLKKSYSNNIRTKYEVLNIFDDVALIKKYVYINNKLKKVKKIFVKKNQKLDHCIVKKISFNAVKLKCNNGIKILSLNKKFLIKIKNR